MIYLHNGIYAVISLYNIDTVFRNFSIVALEYLPITIDRKLIMVTVYRVSMFVSSSLQIQGVST